LHVESEPSDFSQPKVNDTRGVGIPAAPLCGSDEFHSPGSDGLGFDDTRAARYSGIAGDLGPLAALADALTSVQ
jgi:hypothetical protein